MSVPPYTAMLARTNRGWRARVPVIRSGWLLVLSVALLLGPALRIESVVATENHASFSIPKTISSEDESYVREGVALAQNYVAETLSDVSDAPLVINVRNSDDTTSAHAVAFYGGDYIVVFTKSPGWIELAPFDRVHVVVHEYIHAYQHAMLHGGEDALPVWFLEGMAEYLSYDAVAQLGIVRSRDVHDFHSWAVASNPNLPALDDLEKADAFYSEYGPVYSLAYLAFDHMLDGRSPGDLDRFFKATRSSHDWRDAYERIFGQDIATFYRSFADARDGLVAPISEPDTFAPVIPEEIKSGVSIDSTTSPLAVGEQLTVLAQADAGAICQLRLSGQTSGKSLNRTTFADASGHLFWLVTIPSSMGPGAAAMTASCGGKRSSTEIEITDAHD
ncbi:MAG: collagenase [Thermomicrobiales bacterium]